MHDPVRLVTFDLDDTLWDVAPVLVRAEQRLYQWLQQQTPELTRRYDSLALQQRMAKQLAAMPELAHQISQLRILALEQALADSGYASDRAAQLARDAFAVFLGARHEVEYFEHALEILATLSKRYTLGAITNGNADVKRLELAPYFDFALAAEQLRASKPAPDLFLAALDRSGVPAAAAVHVGDHIENDIRAAQALDIRTVWVNFQRQPWPGGPPPAATIYSLSELPAVLRRLEDAKG